MMWGWGGYGGWGPGWGHAAGWVGSIFMFVIWVLIIVGIVFFVRFLVRQSRGGRGLGGQDQEDSALEILKKRYARGEIGKEEFEAKRKDLM
jgi:putative membrane protein